MRNIHIQLISSLIVLLTNFSCTVQAASFDCGRATLKLEQLVCSSETVSALDDDLNFTYQENLELADETQKHRLLTEQNHWIKFTRNYCKNENCLEKAYWSRLVELRTFFESHSSLYKDEADKAPPIREILATSTLKLTDTSAPSKFCNEILSDLKEMNNVRFVNPVAQGQSYEDAVFDPYKKNCKNKAPWKSGESPGKACEGRVGYSPRCTNAYGLPLYKLYKISLPKRLNSPIYVLYSAGSYYVPSPLALDFPATLSGGASSGFVELDVNRCQTTIKNKSFAPIQTNEHTGEDYNSIIEYQQQYYFLTLASNHGAYLLNVHSLSNRQPETTCAWLPMHNNTQTNLGDYNHDN